MFVLCEEALHGICFLWCCALVESLMRNKSKRELEKDEMGAKRARGGWRVRAGLTDVYKKPE